MATAALRGLLRHLHVASKAPASVQNRYIIGGGECPRRPRAVPQTTPPAPRPPRRHPARMGAELTRVGWALAGCVGVVRPPTPGSTRARD